MSATPTAPPGSPFTSNGKVRSTAWEVSVDDAVAAAKSAGFIPTPRSGPARVHVQRDWRTAATISPTPAGVVVKPAWTNAQIVVVVAVLAVLFLWLCTPVA